MTSHRWFSGAAALCVLGVSAYGCSAGDDEGEHGALADAGTSSGAPDSSAAASGSSSSSSSSSSASSSGGSGGSSSGTAGGLRNCTVITPSQWVQTTYEGESIYSATFTPDLPGTDHNALALGFHAPGDTTGDYDLGGAPNDLAATCTQCWSARAGNATKSSVFYFQHEGHLEVTSFTFTTLTATFRGVKLAEVDRAGAVVAGGTCLAVADGTIVVE